MNFAALKAAGTRPLAASELRLLALAGTAPLAVWLGFVGPSVKQAEAAVSGWVYYVMFVTFALFLLALFRLWRARRPAAEPVPRHEAWVVVGVVAIFSWLAFNSEPLRPKVLNDEFVLQSTAFNLHFFREAGTMVRGYEVGGVFLSLDNYLDKRPVFYPFLVSLVHDIAGYHRLNPFLLNVALYPLLLGLAWWLARRLAGPKAGLLAVLLIGTLPIMGQNATGSGMELLNLVMIAAATALSMLYLAKPDETRLSVLVLALVLLCQSRYESAVFVAAGGLVMLVGWWRERCMVLSWSVVVAPLLLVPFALQHKVLANSPVLWELTDEKTVRFSLAYVPENLRHAFNFFASRDMNLGNSWYLSAIGAAGLLWLAAQLWRHRRLRLPEWRPDLLAAAPFVVAIVINLALVMAYYWAGLDDPMASRFALPFYVFLAVLAAVALAGPRAWRWLFGATLAGAVLFTLGSTVPRLSRHGYSNLGIQEQSWLVRTVMARGAGPRIIITHKTTLIWLLEKTPAVLIQRAKLVQDRLRYQLAQGVFREILVTQELRPASAMGQHQVIPADVLPGNFHLETVAEKRFGTKLVRLSRLVAVDEVPRPTAPVATPKPGTTVSASL